MNVQLPVQMTKSAFLAWAEKREGRYELADGHVVMMVGASRAHGQIVANLVAILKGQLDPKLWSVIADFGLDLGPRTLRYPDIVVDRAGGAGSDRTATAPVFLIEVLSPSTADVDLGDKAAEYLRVSSLSDYLVFAQDQPKAWIWMREAGELPATPINLVGYDKIIHIRGLGLTLPFGAIYAGTEPV